VHDRVRVLGTILNDFDPGRNGKGGYYESYYRYQNAAEPASDKAAPVAAEPMAGDSARV
jgi:hypothetical protein